MRGLQFKIALFLVISVVVLSFSGCSRPMPTMNDLKGKWQAVEKENYTLGSGQMVGFTIEFFDDKSIMLPSGKGTWDILPDGRVKIDIPGMTMHATLEEGKLTITMPKNQGKVIFKKL